VSEDEDAAAFLRAAQQGDELGMRRSLASLAPVLTPAIQKMALRHGSLLRRCRLDAEDVVQRVFERMLSSPPSRGGTSAELHGWARTVALNYLLDLARRVGRELEESEEERAPASITAPQIRRHEASEQWALAKQCADEDLVRHKYLRELFYAIASEPELGARELALRIGLLAEDAGEDERRRAEQYVWKLRERVHNRLADYFERRS